MIYVGAALVWLWGLWFVARIVDLDRPLPSPLQSSGEVTEEYIKRFLEPVEGPMALVPEPSAKSTDNPILYSCVAFMYFPWLGADWLARILSERKIEQGLYARHPWRIDPREYKATLQDDHTAIAVVMASEAKSILEYGRKHFWIFKGKDNWKNWLGRFAGFPPTVEVCATRDLGLIAELKLCAAYLFNMLEPRYETSGKQLLWITSFKIPAWKYRPLALALRLWKRRMRKIYPQGPKQMMEIFYWQSWDWFSVRHPFVKHAPLEW